MKTLFIDTHFTDIHIKLFDDKNIINEENVLNEKYNSMFLMPSIKKVCDNNTYNQIVVINGPGSFTGVRLGVTIAKTLAYTQNIDIKPITYFDLMAWSLDNGKHILGISDGNGYFIGEYENYEKTSEYFYLSNSEYAKYSELNNVETDVSINYDNMLDKLKNVDAVNPHGVKPIYVKLIGVEHGSKN